MVSLQTVITALLREHNFNSQLRSTGEINTGNTRTSHIWHSWISPSSQNTALLHWNCLPNTFRNFSRSMVMYLWLAINLRVSAKNVLLTVTSGSINKAWKQGGIQRVPKHKRRGKHSEKNKSRNIYLQYNAHNRQMQYFPWNWWWPTINIATNLKKMIYYPWYCNHFRAILN